MILNIKPLSVNDAWQGRRVKSKKYRQYESDILKLLRPMAVPDGPLELYLKWGFSSAGSDWDNPIKPFQDCLQKKYDFNDNRVARAVTEKVKVKKGEEFIEFSIKKLEN
jgi:Holliday junction resolvase RusA-like endonuclease